MSATRSAGYLAGLVATALREREGEWLEFKRGNVDPKRIGEYFSALANAAALNEQPCAYMFWGVDDDARKPVGTALSPEVSAPFVIPARERVKKNPGAAGVLAGMREAHSPENAGAAGTMPGNTAGRRAWRARAPGSFARVRPARRRGRRLSRDSFTCSKAGFTEEGRGISSQIQGRGSAAAP